MANKKAKKKSLKKKALKNKDKKKKALKKKDSRKKGNKKKKEKKESKKKKGLGKKVKSLLKPVKKKTKKPSKKTGNKTVVKPAEAIIDAPPAKAEISDLSSNYNVRDAVAKLRSLKSIEELNSFTKAESRLTVTKAIPSVIRRLEQ